MMRTPTAIRCPTPGSSTSSAILLTVRTTIPRTATTIHCCGSLWPDRIPVTPIAWISWPYTPPATYGVGALELAARRGPGPSRLYQFLETGSYFRDGLTWTSRAANVAAAGPETTQTLSWTGSTRAMRLFRVAVYAGVTSRTDRVAGVLRTPLVVGQNYVSMPLSAGAGTVAEVIPTNLLPGADAETSAITLSQWDPQTQSLTTPIWLSRLPAYPGWRQAGSFNDANGTVLDPTRGLVITLRSAHGGRTPVSGRHGADERVDRRFGGRRGLYAGGGAVPFRSHPRGEWAAGRRFSGRRRSRDLGSAAILQRDERRVHDPCLVRHGRPSQWRDASTYAVSTKTLLPGQPVLIRRRGATGFTWTIQRPYALP
jgi:hypothetical protein